MDTCTYPYTDGEVCVPVCLPITLTGENFGGGEGGIIKSRFLISHLAKHIYIGKST